LIARLFWPAGLSAQQTPSPGRRDLPPIIVERPKQPPKARAANPASPAAPVQAPPARQTAVEDPLDPVTKFATLNPTSSFNYPGQVTVVGRDQIEIQQPSSFGEAVKYVSGVFVDGGVRSSGQSPNIRGFEGDNVLMVVDGVRQDFQSGHHGRIFIDPDLLKTVEVSLTQGTWTFLAASSGLFIGAQIKLVSEAWSPWANRRPHPFYSF
jgi:outer membrane receptor protein involved in Fe transport